MISYKEFERHISAIQNVSRLRDELCGLIVRFVGEL